MDSQAEIHAEDQAPVAQLHVYAFGKLRLQFEGRLVTDFPTRRVEALAGFLLLHPNTLHSREKLIDLLWPDNMVTNGRASLSTALWRLGTVFQKLGLPADDLLQVSRDWVGFVPERPVVVDVDFFESRLNAAYRAADGDDLEQILREALAVYQGELCEGIYAEWCLLERERLERDYLRAMGRLMVCTMARHAYDEAVAAGQDIIRLDPLREEVHRALMYCYSQQGHHALAVRQFQLCARLLQTELHVMPMPETITLYRQIIEARLAVLQAQSPDPSTAQERLQAAYSRFTAAAEELNALLEGGE